MHFNFVGDEDSREGAHVCAHEQEYKKDRVGLVSLTQSHIVDE